VVPNDNGVQATVWMSEKIERNKSFAEACRLTGYGPCLEPLRPPQALKGAGKWPGKSSCRPALWRSASARHMWF